ncbi:MAG: extracellular solute-binding protein [Gloeomargarita sp. SKYBB_i_bin120]|nr:extracellular solute-binding protein [Gloeomargarita sp. SKYG98]MCS7292814.1 extracellular solute-binding protein [Gloeomargarita sp. SKYB120]MDW8178377.1 extracellular solute-binding protein [Gloeomargarita sp. SKYBB_i_bin120]
MTLTRRGLLLGGLSWLAGCTVGGLRVHLLKNSLPPLWLRRFRRRYGLQPHYHRDLGDLYRQLTRPSPPEVVSLGLAWLTQARVHRYLAPLPTPTRESALPVAWQKIGQFQGQWDWLPYRWGTTVLAYRRDLLPWQPQDWPDLWRPELRQRVSMVAHFREALGIACKSLGLSLNPPLPWPTTDLQERLATLHQQVRFYSDRYYIQPLILGDVWVAVGWSSDLVPISRRYPQIAVVTPTSGSGIWADGWVVPAGQPISEAARAWLNFAWEPAQVEALTAQGLAFSPIAQPLGPHEFWLPMDAPTQQAYQSLRRWWLTLPLAARGHDQNAHHRPTRLL